MSKCLGEEVEEEAREYGASDDAQDNDGDSSTGV